MKGPQITESAPRAVIVTGPSGSGRSTAINAFEDLGFEAIDNLPQSLLMRLLCGPPLARSIVVGIDPRNREFDTGSLNADLAEITGTTGLSPDLLYLDCSSQALINRFSETRRRHPMSPEETPLVGIEREKVLLEPLLNRADTVIDTTPLSAQQLRREIARRFREPGTGPRLAVTLSSFSYKKGLPQGLDLAFDVRFLRNPYWQADLRSSNGLDPRVRAFIEADPGYAPFMRHLLGLLRFLLPAYRAEGKSYLGIGIGCTGGQHRSVAVAAAIASALVSDGWRVSTEHQALEGARTDAGPGLEVGSA